MTFSRWRESALSDGEAFPEASKNNVFSASKVMANSGEVGAAAGVVRRSDTTVAMMLLTAVCELALRFVCTPTGSKPRTAIKQNAATPKARTTSSKENAAALDLEAVS